MVSDNIETQFIECPFCQGLVEPVPGRQKCLECKAQFRIDTKLNAIFADIKELKLPVQGTLCPHCGLIQDEMARNCAYCKQKLSSTTH